MYLIKNAFRNVTRSKGRNILIGIIITVIVLCTCIALSIHKAGSNLVNTYKSTTPLEVSFTLDMNSLRNASDSSKTNFESLSVEDILNYTDSDYVKDYYYTLESTLSSDSVDAVEDNVKPVDENSSNENAPSMNNSRNDKMQSMGDFRITAYSNFAYLEDFTEGTKKITSGTMISADVADNSIVISEALAEANDLKIDDEITFYLPNDSTTTFTFKIVGIYEDNSSTATSSFMSMNAMNSSNQIYTNTTKLQEILDSSGESTDNTKLVKSNGLDVKIYLNDDTDLKAYTKEVQKKGLSSYYSVSTNEEEVESTLQPIKNITSFSFTFLIVILIIGIVVLTVINFLNIRDRKYEIGVLRAIGMSKVQVTLQLMTEIFIVALISLILGTLSGTLLSQPVTNSILSSEISSYTEQTENNQNNFGGAGFNKPSQNISGNNAGNHNFNKENKNQTTTNYVDSLKVKLDVLTIIELFGITILLTVASGAAASIIVNKYNPNKILQDRM